MAEHGYSFSLTTFSLSGKLVQIDYALAAIAGGAPSVGIKAANGMVLALLQLPGDHVMILPLGFAKNFMLYPCPLQKPPAP